MSADNWAKCPRCIRRHEQAAEKLRAEADQAYGTVPTEIWMEMNRKANAALGPLPDDTFREDYDLGVTEDGEFYVTYSGGCDVCNLSFSFKEEQKVDIA